MKLNLLVCFILINLVSFHVYATQGTNEERCFIAADEFRENSIKIYGQRDSWAYAYLVKTSMTFIGLAMAQSDKSIAKWRPDRSNYNRDHERKREIFYYACMRGIRETPIGKLEKNERYRDSYRFGLSHGELIIRLWGRDKQIKDEQISVQSPGKPREAATKKEVAPTRKLVKFLAPTPLEIYDIIGDVLDIPNEEAVEEITVPSEELFDFLPRIISHQGANNRFKVEPYFTESKKVRLGMKGDFLVVSEEGHSGFAIYKLSQGGKRVIYQILVYMFPYHTSRDTPVYGAMVKGSTPFVSEAEIKELMIRIQSYMPSVAY